MRSADVQMAEYLAVTDCCEVIDDAVATESLDQPGSRNSMQILLGFAHARPYPDGVQTDPLVERVRQSDLGLIQLVAYIPVRPRAKPLL